MAILESVRELASKLGAETNGRDITDQLNKINKHLDETALSGRDIAEAVKTYSKNASGGGGGGETFEVNVTFNEETEKLEADKTLTQTLEAYNNGCNIVFKGLDQEHPDLATSSFSVMCTDESHPQTVTNIYGNFGLAPNATMDNKFFGYGVYYLNENELAVLYLIEYTG